MVRRFHARRVKSRRARAAFPLHSSSARILKRQEERDVCVPIFASENFPNAHAHGRTVEILAASKHLRFYLTVGQTANLLAVCWLGDGKSTTYRKKPNDIGLKRALIQQILPTSTETHSDPVFDCHV